jgi:hypothetical protein
MARRESGALITDEGAVMVLDEPKGTEIATLCLDEYEVIDVSPIVEQNTSFRTLFGTNGPPPRRLLVRGGRKNSGEGRLQFCGTCKHPRHSPRPCSECGPGPCTEVCKKCLIHPPHPKGPCPDCVSGVGKLSCVEHCPVCRHPGTRTSHSKDGCAVCGDSGRCATAAKNDEAEAQGDDSDGENLSGDEDDGNDDDTEALQRILEAVDAQGQIDHIIEAIDDAPSEVEVQQILDEHHANRRSARLNRDCD